MSDSSSNLKQCSSSGVEFCLPFSRLCHMYTLTHFLCKICAQWGSGRSDQKQGGKKLKHLLVLETRPGSRVSFKCCWSLDVSSVSIVSHSASLRLCTQIESTVAGVASSILLTWGLWVSSVPLVLASTFSSLIWMEGSYALRGCCAPRAALPKPHPTPSSWHHSYQSCSLSLHGREGAGTGSLHLLCGCGSEGALCPA